MDTSAVCIHNLIHFRYSSVDKNLPFCLLVFNGTAKKDWKSCFKPLHSYRSLKDEFHSISVTIKKKFREHSLLSLLGNWEIGKRNELLATTRQNLFFHMKAHDVQMRDIGSFRICFNVSKIHVQVRNVLMLLHRFIY